MEEMENIDTALNPTTAGRVTRDTSVTAQSLRGIQDSELQTYVLNNVNDLVGSAMSGQGVFGTAGADVSSALEAIQNYDTGGRQAAQMPSRDQYNQVLGFLRSRAGQVVQEGLTRN